VTDFEEPLDPQPEPGDLPYDASDPVQVAEAKTAEGRREKRLKQTLVGILSVKDGREWIWELLSNTGMYQQSFVRGEPESTAFNEGKRSIGNLVLTQIVSADPQAFVTMMREFGGKNG
jgi:hypothetical protein